MRRRAPNLGGPTCRRRRAARTPTRRVVACNTPSSAAVRPPASTARWASPPADQPSCAQTVVGQPPARESGGPQSGDEVPASAHQLPYQPRLVVLDHRDARPFVDTKVPLRHPAIRQTTWIGERRIERRLEAVSMVAGALP